MSGEGGSRSCSDSLLVSSPSVGADVDACTVSWKSARTILDLRTLKSRASQNLDRHIGLQFMVQQAVACLH